VGHTNSDSQRGERRWHNYLSIDIGDIWWWSPVHSGRNRLLSDVSSFLRRFNKHDGGFMERYIAEVYSGTLEKILHKPSL